MAEDERNLTIEGEPSAPFKIYVLGVDRYGKTGQPVQMVAECWTEEEVLNYKTRLDKRYAVFVNRAFVALHEFKKAKGRQEK